MIILHRNFLNILHRAFGNKLQRANSVWKIFSCNFFFIAACAGVQTISYYTHGTRIPSMWWYLKLDQEKGMKLEKAIFRLVLNSTDKRLVYSLCLLLKWMAMIWKGHTLTCFEFNWHAPELIWLGLTCTWLVLAINWLVQMA